MEHAVMCPQCNAPLTLHRFARSIVCSYCGATVLLDISTVSASRFHESFRDWNSPATYQIPSWISIGNRHWALEKRIAQGDISDVYTARLVRFPTELVIMKVLRDRRDAVRFDNEWQSLQALQQSEASGADSFTRLLPQPVVHGDIADGQFAGQRTSIYRWESGFYHTFEDVLRAYPQGIPPQASIWVWRRILEMLSFIHASGMAHGAVLPAHLLVQENDHGVRLVGYGFAGKLNDKLRPIPDLYNSFFPKSAQTLTAQLDIIMSARCIAAVLGGTPETAALPKTVPAPLASIVQRTALASPASVAAQNAWSIREELGQIARQAFGPPRFMPIVMPS